MKNQFPERKTIRLAKQNYSSPGAYFITICTHNRKQILSNIVGAIHESPVVVLTDYGKIVDKIINNLPEHLCVGVDKYIIMPNHIHIIFSISCADAERAIRESPLRSKSLISSAVGYIKMNSSKLVRQKYGEVDLWQRSFYDHIIRNDEDYYESARYIEENPLRWERDELYLK